ncbi:hypothetical protein BG004_007966, partial [Podila humilis]
MEDEKHLQQLHRSFGEDIFHPSLDLFLINNSTPSLTGGSSTAALSAPASITEFDFSSHFGLLDLPSPTATASELSGAPPFQALHPSTVPNTPTFEHAPSVGYLCSDGALLPFEDGVHVSQLRHQHQPSLQEIQNHAHMQQQLFQQEKQRQQIHPLEHPHDESDGKAPPSPSPSTCSSTSSSIDSDPSSPMHDDVVVPVVACASCKRSHIKCDHGRPCQNCLKHPSKAITCHDAVPKPRGRPKGGSKIAAEAMMLAKR